MSNANQNIIPVYAHKNVYASALLHAFLNAQSKDAPLMTSYAFQNAKPVKHPTVVNISVYRQDNISQDFAIIATVGEVYGKQVFSIRGRYLGDSIVLFEKTFSVPHMTREIKQVARENGAMKLTLSAEDLFIFT